MKKEGSAESSDSAASLTYQINNNHETKMKNSHPDEEILEPQTPENTIKNKSIKEESSVKSSNSFSDFTQPAL